MPKKQVDPNEEISGGDAARILNVTRQHVNRLAHDGKLPARQMVGHFWVFKRGDVEAYKHQPKSKGGRPKAGAGTLTPTHPA